MSEQPAIQLKGVGKRYTLYPSPLARACDAFGLAKLVPGWSKRFRQFWALRNINLTLPRGARIGIIGRNGAGKSTLLKLITGNIDPTEGQVEVNGEVQALLQSGTSLHSEFTGYENIEAATTYQGMTAAAIKDAVADIEVFTELRPFPS
jgi:lipopolysaccharide transport system ATP-binding protein